MDITQFCKYNNLSPPDLDLYKKIYKSLEPLKFEDLPIQIIWDILLSVKRCVLYKLYMRNNIKIKNICDDKRFRENYNKIHKPYGKIEILSSFSIFDPDIIEYIKNKEFDNNITGLYIKRIENFTGFNNNVYIHKIIFYLLQNGNTQDENYTILNYLLNFTINGSSNEFTHMCMTLLLKSYSIVDLINNPSILDYDALYTNNYIILNRIIRSPLFKPNLIYQGRYVWYIIFSKCKYLLTLVYLLDLDIQRIPDEGFNGIISTVQLVKDLNSETITNKMRNLGLNI